MTKNKLIVAAAGSGKTTLLVDEALKQKGAIILITTYTEANEAEIRRKIINKNKYIPKNITVQSWFSFLLEHGAKPYQGCLFKKNIDGMLLVNEQSGLMYKTNKGIPVYYSETNEFEKHYFSSNHRIYSDKLSKFVVRCNEKSDGAVIDRLTKIYTHIYIDEIQDLAGYDLEILKLLFTSSIKMLLVGDPRQGTYSTNNSQKNKKYQKSKILNFFEDKSIQIETDKTTLLINHRCVKEICDLSNKLFPDLPMATSGKQNIVDHTGVFFIKREDVNRYLELYNPIQLRWNKSVKVNDNYPVKTYGETKGITFERILIYPTDPFTRWILNNNNDIPLTSRAKFYVALTRAEYSVGIVYDYKNSESIDDIENYVLD